MKVLIVAEHDGVELSVMTRAAIHAVQALASDIVCLVAGEQVDVVAAIAARTEGVTAVQSVCSDVLSHRLAEPWAALIAEQASGFTHIVMGSSSFSKNILPRAAALCEAEPISDVLKINAPGEFVRPIYAGNIWQTILSQQPQHFLTVRATAFEKASTDAAATPVVIESATFSWENSAQSRWVSCQEAKSERPSLSSAAMVFSGGRGLQNKESFDRLEKLAVHYGAAMGASRAAVDAGMAPNDWQVGQTGQVVAPAIYIAWGISGAIQHLAGMSDSKIIVAINKDPDAPIFSVADYGLVADTQDVLLQWEKMLD